MKQSSQDELQAAGATNPEFCKPEANEMYYRFKNFLNTGQRTVIPDPGKEKSAPRKPCRATGGVATTTDSSAALGVQEITVGASVEIQGLQTKPDLNGQIGIVLLFDSSTERYEVQLSDGQHKRIRAGNLKLLQEFSKSTAGALHQESVSPLVAQPTQEASSTYVGGSVTGKVGNARPGGPVHMQGPQDGPEPLPPGLKRVAQQVQEESGNAAGMLPVRYLAVGGSDDDEADVTLQSSVLASKTECVAGEDTIMQASSNDFAPGARVQIHSLSARPDLNGKEEFIRGLDSTMGRWVVDVDGRHNKLHTANIQALSSGTRSKPSNANIRLGIHALTSASDILALCEGQRAALTPADIAEALKQISKCTDCSLARATSSFADLLTHFCFLLEDEAAPADVLSVLSSLVESNVTSAPVLEVIARCALRHADRFLSRDVARILMGFSELGYGDVQLFDGLARKLRGNAAQVTASDCMEIACAFWRVRLCHFELLDELAEQVASQLDGLSEEQLVAGIEAFSALDALRGALLEAARGEAMRRAGRLSLGQLLRLVRQPGRCCGERWAAARDALDKAAGSLAQDADSVDFAELAGLVDAFPCLRGRLEPRLRGCVRAAVASLRGFEPGGNLEAKVAELRGACPDSLGVWGTRLVVAELGASPVPAGLVRRALNRISWACTAVEDWTVQTMRKRSFAFTEYRFGVDEACPVEGNLVCHDGARPSEPPPALASTLLSAGVVSLGDFCALCWVLCDVYKLACEAAGRAQADRSGIEKEPTAQQTLVESTTGSLQVFAMEPPGLTGLLLVRRIQTAMPWLTVSISIGAEVEAEMPSDEVLDTELDDEVLDANFAEEPEVMEAVD